MEERTVKYTIVITGEVPTWDDGDIVDRQTFLDWMGTEFYLEEMVRDASSVSLRMESGDIIIDHITREELFKADDDEQ